MALPFDNGSECGLATSNLTDTREKNKQMPGGRSERR
jgi:hypothetical protein